MPNFKKEGSNRYRKKSMNGPTIKETYKTSEKQLDSSDITTSIGA